ncbi:hypothetical protein MK541_04650 [Streptococcus gallolyticus subsp. gallolyticus]|uniref:hypothetical protein n=1 Tax=Streptococcus gallolyticus TaxID=315405 RepID=UPI0022844346|nr:hypothetical protein [Streptococcus gallolyticus]MCY7151466.1 hypothetical protein [Streptococcus gallolyticus subsp. gallolyticus]
MKKTLFNASLEESMNLVTDKYIQTSMEDINEKGYWRKIIGFFTVLFFSVCLHGGISVFKNNAGIDFTLLSYIIMVVNIYSVVRYLLDVRKIKNNRILSYYYYNKDIFLLVFGLALQTTLISIAGATMVLGKILANILYGLVFLFIFLERYQWFKRDALKALYGQQSFKNPLARFLDYFVTFSKKYGGIVVLLLFIAQFFLPGTGKSDIYHNDVIRNVVLMFSPLLFVLGFYFVIALGADNFQGYYLQKYLEDYRQLSDYSIEEWYGKKSKMYKESLKN